MIYDDATVEPLRRSHHDEIVARLQQGMAGRELDALVIFRSDHFNWVNAHESMFLRGGIQGMAMLVIPREGAAIGICADHEFEAMDRSGAVEDWRAVRTWTGLEDRYAKVANTMRYASEGQNLSPEGLAPFFHSLRNVLREIGLARGRLGVEINDLKYGIYRLLAGSLPDAQLADSQPLIQQAVMSKTPYEIFNTRYAAFQQWNRVHDVMMNIRAGDSDADICQRINEAVVAAPSIEGNRFLMLYMGESPSPTARYGDKRIAAGDMISIDLAFSVRGYASDSGRAYVLGEPSDLQARIARVYAEAHREVKRAMVPGARLGDLYDMAADMVRGHRLTDFKRGHIGHGLGCCTYVEEFPFIMRGADTVLRPNMIMTLEIPFYGQGLGAYFEEDIVLITEDGNESLTSAPFGLNVITA